jgi:predicted metalloprotease with PDZ domain
VLDEATREPIGAAPVFVDSPRADQDAVTSADGRFQLRAAAGEHTLRAFLPRYRALSRDFTVQAGQALDLGDVTILRMSAQSGTIGASLRGDSDMPPTIMFLIPDGPAEKAGLHLGDQIALVDGAAVKGVSDATRRIQGPPGTPVQLGVVRSGVQQGFTVTRAP